MPGDMRKVSFLYYGGPVKFVQACVSARKDGESSVHHCVGLVKLVQGCFWPGIIKKAMLTTVEVL